MLEANRYGFCSLHHVMDLVLSSEPIIGEWTMYVDVVTGGKLQLNCLTKLIYIGNIIKNYCVDGLST